MTLMGVATGLMGALAALSVGAQTPAQRSAQGSSIPLPIDACSLLTAAEIAQVIGQPVDEGRRNDDGLTRKGSWSSTCLWRVVPAKPVSADPTKPLGGASFVILNAVRWPAGRAGEFLQDFRDAARRGDIPHQPVTRHIGDDALWWGDGLAVRRRDMSFGLSIHTPDGGKKGHGEREANLAPLVLKRLDAVR